MFVCMFVYLRVLLSVFWYHIFSSRNMHGPLFIVLLSVLLMIKNNITLSEEILLEMPFYVN